MQGCGLKDHKTVIRWLRSTQQCGWQSDPKILIAAQDFVLLRYTLTDDRVMRESKNLLIATQLLLATATTYCLCTQTHRALRRRILCLCLLRTHTFLVLVLRTTSGYMLSYYLHHLYTPVIPLRTWLRMWWYSYVPCILTYIQKKVRRHVRTLYGDNFSDVRWSLRTD